MKDVIARHIERGQYQLANQLAAHHGLVEETRVLINEHNRARQAVMARGIDEMLARREQLAWVR